jgi:RsiW-degrading membrane proteinase PrsW (M82 family)
MCPCRASAWLLLSTRGADGGQEENKAFPEGFQSLGYIYIPLWEMALNVGNMPRFSCLTLFPVFYHFLFHTALNQSPVPTLFFIVLGGSCATRQVSIVWHTNLQVLNHFAELV